MNSSSFTYSLFNYLCVTAAGCGLVIPGYTSVPTRAVSGLCMHWVITVTRSVTVMNTISTFMGGHALTSPKGGRPCPLGTLNYGVVGHLAFRLT